MLLTRLHDLENNMITNVNFTEENVVSIFDSKCLIYLTDTIRIKLITAAAAAYCEKHG